MQQLLAELLPWLAAFYVLDAVVHIRRGQFVLSSAWGGRFRLLRSGLHFLGWAPSAEAIATVDLPWLATRTTLLVFDADRKADLTTVGEVDVDGIAWTDVAPEAIGRKVRAHGRTLLVAPHRIHAAHAAHSLASLAATPEHALGSPAQGLKISDARHRQRWWRRGLKLTGWLLFAHTFALAAIAAHGGLFLVLLLDVGLDLWFLLLGVEFFLAVGYLRAGGAGRWDALSRAGWLIVWPVAALHPLLNLSFCQGAERPALDVAAAVLPVNVFTELVATEWGRAKAGAAATNGQLAEALVARAREVSEAAKRAGIAERFLREPPSRRLGEAVWCPACRSGFVEGTAHCPECGVPLRDFADRATSSHRGVGGGRARLQQAVRG